MPTADAWSAVGRWLPGLGVLRSYDRSWLGKDLVAGVSVAAVQIPVAIAYAELAGFAPVVGLYASIPTARRLCALRLLAPAS